LKKQVNNLVVQVEKAKKSLLNASTVKEKLIKFLKDNNALKLIINEHNMDYHILMKLKKDTKAIVIPREDGGKEVRNLV